MGMVFTSPPVKPLFKKFFIFGRSTCLCGGLGLDRQRSDLKSKGFVHRLRYRVCNSFHACSREEVGVRARSIHSRHCAEFQPRSI